MASLISLSCICRSLGKCITPSLRNFANQPKLVSYLNFASHRQLRQCAFVHRRFSSAKPLPQKETVTIHFITRSGKKLTTKAAVGDNFLDVVVENDLDLDGYGACEGTLACSTCHLVFSQDHYDKLQEKPTDEELDMLDLAYDLSDTSRLGCQVVVTKEMEGWKISVPAGVADART